jgi:hypothetical protein
MRLRNLVLGLTSALVITTSADANSPAQKTPPSAEGRGTVEFWQRELSGRSKKDVKALLGTPTSIAEQGSVYFYPEEFFHPDLDEWRTLLVRFNDMDQVEGFSGDGGDSKTYQVNQLRDPSPIPGPTPEGLAEGRRTAVEIADFVKRNRNFFKDYEGREVTVTGVVHSLRLESSRSAKIVLRTESGLPKVVLHYTPTSSLGPTPELRLSSATTIERRGSKEDEWSPLTAVGREIGATGALASYHINVEIKVDEMTPNL